MSQDPITLINDIFIEHNVACAIAFDVSTRGVPVSQRRMMHHQFRHTFPEYEVSLHSDHFHFAVPHRVSA